VGSGPVGSRHASVLATMAASQSKLRTLQKSKKMPIWLKADFALKAQLGERREPAPSSR